MGKGGSMNDGKGCWSPHLSALIAVVLWGSMIMVNLKVVETIARGASKTDDLNSISMNLYTWLGGIFGWVPFWLAMNCAHSWLLAARRDQKALFVLNLIFGVIFYVHMATMGLVPPSHEWRYVELGERSIGAKLHVVGCWHSESPSSLTVPTDAGYIDLMDREWYVDWESKVVTTLYGYSWVLGKIRYNGTVAGCQFDPPLWAACIGQKPTLDSCGWRTYGRSVMMRRLHLSQWIETSEWGYFPFNSTTGKPQSGGVDYVFEFDSPWPEEVMAYLDRVKRESGKQYLIYLISWLASSLSVYAVFAWIVERNRPPEDPPSTVAVTIGQYCSQPTAAADLCSEDDCPEDTCSPTPEVVDSDTKCTVEGNVETVEATREAFVDNPGV